MSIDSLAITEGPSVFYDDAFRAVLEDHMTYLRIHPGTTTMAVDPNEAYRWIADLFGLLGSRGVPAYMHWVVMRMNNLTSPTEMGENIRTLLIPDVKVLSVLRNIHNTKAKLKT
jgi:predicted NBD/HSP70 family sugar kinase